jgi:mRNA interferase MazF
VRAGPNESPSVSASFPRRGELYWVSLDPTIGSEIAKTRPCLVISNDIGNRYSDRVTIAPITASGLSRIYPYEVLVKAGEGGLDRDSKVVLDNIRSVDKRRLGRRIGALREGLMRGVNRAIRLSLAVDRD